MTNCYKDMSFLNFIEKELDIKLTQSQKVAIKLFEKVKTNSNDTEIPRLSKSKHEKPRFGLREEV